MTTDPKCGAYLCQRRDDCARYRSSRGQAQIIYHPDRPWLCFVAKIHDGFDTMQFFEFQAIGLSVRMDILEFDLNELVRCV